MAKPASFNKKDIEKKKAEKRKEKQLRKEQRKSTQSGAFEDMIAYVDANGMITDTPPELREKEEAVSLSDISISTPQKEEVIVDPVHNGRVEHFNSSKGFGFIKDMDSTEKYFFHISNVSGIINEGTTVQFELEKGKKGLNAINILPHK